ncbi:MAG: phosphate signaling complex protein PhoU [Oligoflexia bacterium]|nr:phosphate signaling complex protein PhoU [Oligoflexia bacterium]
MSERSFDTHFRELKEHLLTMGGYVERSIEHATKALLEGDPAVLAMVYEIENKINQSHKLIDDGCVKLLATQQPMATDLRTIVAILKINTDLERMGDQAVNIAHNSERYLKEIPLQSASDLKQMAESAKQMVGLALDAFTQKSTEIAQTVVKKDDEVDNLKNKIFHQVLDYLKTHEKEVEQGLNVILIARNLERIGDHATHIAEEVIFALTGADIRHPQSAGVKR